jgi:uncharacterized protein YciI
MVYYVVKWKYTEDNAKVAAARQAHVDYLKEIQSAGSLAVAGGWSDGSGGLVVFDVEDRNELIPILENDPFTIEDVIVETEIHEWKVGVGSVGN